MRAEFDLSALLQDTPERQALENHILPVYYKIKSKYRCSLTMYRLIQYSISLLSLSITILNIYLTQEYSLSTTKGISQATVIISAVIASINQFADRSKVQKKLILYKRSSNKIKDRITNYLIDTSQDFIEFQNDIERIIKKIHEIEIELLTSNIQRSFTPPKIEQTRVNNSTV